MCLAYGGADQTIRAKVFDAGNPRGGAGRGNAHILGPQTN
jgi:hypothetical protein